MTISRLLLSAAALIALAGCQNAPTQPSAEDPAAAFEQLEVASDFRFATRKDVKLRLQAAEPGVAKYVEVSDDEGRRLFAGAVIDSIDLDFDIRKGAPVLNVRVGRGTEATTQTVNLEDGLGTASF